MRIGGLATGMDTDQIVEDLMKVEKMPLDKLQQDKTKMEWQRDAFCDVNKLFSELDDQGFDMRLQKTYNSKSTTSSMSSAVTATASASASNGTYEIKVEQLASAAINAGSESIAIDGESIDPTSSMSSQNDLLKGELQTGEFAFATFNEDGEEIIHTITVSEDDSLNDVLKDITSQDNGVRAFFDPQSNKVVMERTETGDFNPDGAEISFNVTDGDSSFFTDILGLSEANEQGGENAIFTYNNALTLESKTNTYTLNDMTLTFTETTGDSSARIAVSNDVDGALDKITQFVDKYNEVIETVNERLSEEQFRDYKPLTDEQKNAMSEKEIELWEEKAKSGLLKGESILSSGLSNMRQNWYNTVENESSFNHLSQIGITTSSNFRDGGKLLIDEDKLKQALTDDSSSVYKLFSNDVEGSGRGIINRLDDSINNTIKRIESRAGKSTHTLEQYTMGKRIKDMDSRISSFEKKLIDIEDRYWRQFTQMEKAVQQMNSQHGYLMQQFGFGM